VAHATRWDLPLLSAPECIQYAEQTLQNTLDLLEQEPVDSPALYFYWLVLQHEAMHLEASAYMAQSLGLPFQARWQPSETTSLPHTTQAVTAHVDAQSWTLGSEAERPFCFDNELSQHYELSPGLRDFSTTCQLEPIHPICHRDGLRPAQVCSTIWLGA